MAKDKKTTACGRWVWIIIIVALLAGMGVTALFWMDISKVKCCEQLTVEAGQPLPVAADFLPDHDGKAKEQIAFLTDIGEISTDVPGSYPIRLQIWGRTLQSLLVIADTTAPTAQVQDVTLYNPEALTPEAFVVKTEDVTKVQVSFQKKPDLTKEGKQQVTLVLTDAAGNKTLLQATLTVILDKTAPVIAGVKDLETYVGDTVAYRTGVTVTDDYDAKPVLSVDSSGVDLSAPGVYTVTYRATDSAGNTQTVTAKITVRKKTDKHVEPEVIYAAVDALLAKFIREDMTDREKVEAVYCWTRMHLQYGSSRDSDDWLQSAYELLQKRKGDCFRFFALQKLMLQRLDIPTIDVRKVKNHEKDTDHFWLLVSIDKGETYYHMDNVWSKELCLVTDQKLDKFSEAFQGCFNRDKSLYPPTPEKALPWRALPWDDPAICNTLP